MKLFNLPLDDDLKVMFKRMGLTRAVLRKAQLIGVDDELMVSLCDIEVMHRAFEFHGMTGDLLLRYASAVNSIFGPDVEGIKEMERQARLLKLLREELVEYEARLGVKPTVSVNWLKPET